MSDNTTSSLLNTMFGRYQIQEHLGSGGMARVYKAWDTNLDRAVAIKVLHEHLADDVTFKERFEREAKFVASFNHPNIVQVYDFDSVERNGQQYFYMVMPFIPGKSLAEVLEDLNEKDEIMDRDRVLAIMLDLTSALSYAHDRGMVHRDVKPANILFDENNRAVLTDFGIARLAQSSSLTAEGITIGTPAYMSPEQATGAMVDARSDIYALGIILYELLTGKTPFKDEGGISVLLQHLNAPVPSLSETAQIDDTSLDAVVFRALAKRPEDRFQTVDQFANDLRSVFSGDPISFSPISTQQLMVSVLPSHDEEATGQHPGSPPVTKPRSQSPLGIFAIGMTVIVVLLAIFLIGNQLNNRAVPPTPTVESSVGNQQVSEVEGMTGNLYFKSEFTADDTFNRYWPQQTDPMFSQVIAEGAYRLSDMQDRTAVTSLFDLNYTYEGTITIDMNASLDANSSAASGYGIVYDYQDEDNYYVFAVDGLSRYSIWVRKDGQWHELRNAADNWTEDASVHPIAESNELTLYAHSGTFTGYVNGMKVTEIQDASFDHGGIGIYLASTSEANTLVNVDSYEVSNQPPSFAEAMTDEKADSMTDEGVKAMTEETETPTPSGS